MSKPSGGVGGKGPQIIDPLTPPCIEQSGGNQRRDSEPAVEQKGDSNNIVFLVSGEEAQWVENTCPA